METIILNLKCSHDRTRWSRIRRERRIRRAKTAIKLTLWGVFIAFWAWLILSYFNIIAHNMDPEPVYWAWNFFVLAF